MDDERPAGSAQGLLERGAAVALVRRRCRAAESSPPPHPGLAARRQNEPMNDLLERAKHGDHLAASVIEETLERLAWRSGLGEFPSRPPTAEDRVLIDSCLALMWDRQWGSRAREVLMHLPAGEIEMALLRRQVDQEGRFR
jgi:hypothetical protein